tara:strand:+ start:11412 stop:11636 length:225 start_codon:yes stop_codon:yes gene_type:complete
MIRLDFQIVNVPDAGARRLDGKTILAGKTIPAGRNFLRPSIGGLENCASPLPVSKVDAIAPDSVSSAGRALIRI